MLIVDSHLDLAWNALQWNRDLTQSVYTVRTREGSMTGKGRAVNTVCLPDMARGRVVLCFATVLARSTGNAVEHIDFASAQQAYGVAQGQIAYYRALEASGHIRLIADRAALDTHMAGWQTWESGGAQDDPLPLGVVLSMESADSILTPDQLGDWWAQGLRLIGPAHYGMGRYAGGTSVEDGLTADGKTLVRRMGELGFILDMTHLSDRAFWKALDIYGGTVIASHNNCRALVPHQRQFSDEQIRAIAERGGVIGAAFDNWMLYPGFVREATPNTLVSIATVVDHIDHVCQLTGSSRHAGIGSDLDGGFGREQSPHDLDTIADLQRIADILTQRGYSADDVSAIMHGNWIALLQRVWG